MTRGLVAAVVCAATAAAAAPAALAPPVLHGRAVVAFSGEPATVRVSWMPVAGATRYHAVWTAGETSVDVETAGPALERGHVAPGRYQLTVSAVDASGALGAMSAPAAIDVVEVRALPPGATAPAPPSHDAYAVGTRLVAPGLHCELDARPSGPPGNELRATSQGMHRLRCANPEGTIATDTALVIAPVLVDLPREARAVPRGRTTKVHLTVASVAALGDDLTISGIGDVELGAPARSPFGFDVPVTLAPDAHRASLVVSAAGLELGEIALEPVAPPPAPPSGATESAWWALDLGGHVGAFVPAQSALAPSIGHPSDPRDAVTGGPMIGAHLGLFPVRRAGLEADVTLVTDGYAGRDAAASLLATRAQLAVRAYDRGGFGVRAIAGAGLYTALRTVDTSHAGASGEVHYGAAITLETHRLLWLRVQALDVITSAVDGGFSHVLEVQLGVVTRLGRRDRW
ncbi:MAG TPA: hypothetical protein VLX92_31220 [Kofleriaceae bacterium]|nr:hypothetical protein [Kofleriaceae bacterium]